MRFTRALPLLALLASLPALAEVTQPSAADITQLLHTMQERLSRLENRNADLERRLVESARPAAKEETLAARVEEVENELLTLRKKPDPLAKFEGFSAGASLTMVAQSASGGATDNSQLTTRADVEVEMPLGSIGATTGKLFAHFRAGEGAGIAPGAFASTNASGDFNKSQPALMQAWYQMDIPVGAAGGNLGQVEVTAGKIDPFGFFDGNNVSDDESEGFLNLAFVHNPLLDAGGDIGVGSDGASPGLRLAYVSDLNGGNHITASLGVFASGPGADFTDSFGNPFSIAQIEYAGKTWNGMAGAYRLYAWNNARAYDQVTPITDTDGDTVADQGAEEKHAGWGFSLDQQVTEHATVFARYGHSSKGTLGFDRAFTLGGQLSGTAWGRENDRLGLGLGWLKGSGEYQTANPGFGSEKIAELFYVWQANENFHLSPSVQWVRHPSGDPGLGSVTVLGLRAKASF